MGAERDQGILGSARVSRTFLFRVLGAAFCLTVADAGTIHGQAKKDDESSDTGPRLSYGFSIGWEQARDDLLVPMRWSGPGVGIRLNWSAPDGSSRHAFDLLLPFSLYKNRFDHRAFGLGIEAGYGYVVPVAEVEDDWDFSLGGQIRWDLHDGYYQSWDEEHAYWLSSLSLGPRFLWKSLGKRDLRVTFDVPLLAGVARPPRHRLSKMDPLTKLSFHLIDMQKGMRLTGIPHFFSVSGRAALPVRRGSAFSLSYDINYTTYNKPDRVVTVSHRFALSRRSGK